MRNQFYPLIIFIFLCNTLFAQKFELLHINKEFDISKQFCLALDSKNKIYLGTDKGLLEYENNQWNHIVLNAKCNLVRDIFIDSKDRVWFITRSLTGTNVYRVHGALYQINDDGKVSANPIIKTSFINCITEDESGDIWVGTGEKGYRAAGGEKSLLRGNEKSGGLYRFKDNNWVVEKEDCLIEKIVKTPTNLFFLKTFDAKGYSFHYVNNEPKELVGQSFWGKQRVFDIAESSNGKTWVCTAENRFQIYNMHKDGTLEEVLKVNPYRYGARGGFIMKNGNLYLTYLGMFLAYSEDKNMWIYPPKQSNQKLKYYISDIEETSDGSVLIATGDGIKTYKNGIISKTKLLEGKKVTMLHALNSDLTLIGTNGDGLFLLENNVVKPIKTDSNGLPMPDTFISLVTNDNKVVVLNTTSGILKITID